MGRKEIRDESNARDDATLPKRDRSGAGQRMAQRRGDDKAVGFEVGNDPSRPSHPKGWQTGGRE
jgi:hypothetical protein